MTKPDAALSAPPPEAQHSAPLPSTAWQTGVGVSIALAAVWLAWGTWQIPYPASSPDTGARWVPGLCAAALLLCGLWLVWEARHGGWRNAAVFSGHAAVQVAPWVWVSAGILLSGLLMAHSGFVVAATLCYVLALHGLRVAAEPALRLQARRLVCDVAIGGLIAAVVFALFTRVFGIALPAGWLTWS